VDLGRSCLTLPDSKTGHKVIHLNAPARAVLEALPRVEGNPYERFLERKSVVALRSLAGKADIRDEGTVSYGAAGGGDCGERLSSSRTTSAISCRDKAALPLCSRWRARPIAAPNRSASNGLSR